MEIAREKDRKLRYQYQVSVAEEIGREESQQATQGAAPRRPQSPPEEVQQQDLLQRITNQLDTLSLHFVQGARASPQPQEENRAQRRQNREFFCYNCGETGHGMYYCPHPRRNPTGARHPRQQVTPPRARPPPPAPPVQPPAQALRPPAPQPQAQAQIPPLPMVMEERAVNVIGLEEDKIKGKGKVMEADTMPIKRARREEADMSELEEAKSTRKTKER